ncbi:MAG: PHP domain-containing protein [Lachnospiraceae bacterium]|nr:PHP domain-containing protein [Lachnospiraceae bacterium]
MNYIDLHVHSNKSDGTLTPAEVAKHAAERGLTAIALTDHDCVSGIDEAEQAAASLRAAGHALRIIPGVEISADYKNGDIHILGLFINPSDPALTAALDEAIRCRDARNAKMVQNLRNAGIDITLEELLFEAKDTVVTRAHFARFLQAHGYVKDRTEAFRRYLDRDTPYYVRREYLQPARAIELIRGAGGVPVLAHPLLYHLTPDGVKELVAQLKSAGLGGIEAIYSANTGTDESFVRQLASRYDLAISGGSDFHGANKPDIEIGTGRGNLRIPEDLLDALRRA